MRKFYYFFMIASLAALLSRGGAAQDNEADAYRFIGGEKVQLIFDPASLGEIKEQVVSDEGVITLPTGSTVNVKGKTNLDARELLARQIQKDTSAKQARVRILILDQPPRKINVGGEVRLAKSITLTPGVPLSLIGAIQEAGGVNEQGDPTRVNLVRTEADGKRTSSVIDLTKLAQPGSADLGPKLIAGDVVLVPRGEHYVFNGEFNRIGVISVGDLHMEPGEKPLLSRVIAGTGGLRRDADVKSLKIMRMKPDGVREVIMPYGGATPQDPLLISGDIVQVAAKEQAVANAPLKSVSLLGKVRTPGIYAIGENGLKLSKLIVQAGGFTEFAKSKKVVLNRPGASCLSEIDVDAILKKGAWQNDVELQDGDVVNVPERAF